MPTKGRTTALRSGAEPDPLVLWLTDIDATMLASVGGKAANLGELIRAGLRVPQGFCLTTRAYEAVAEVAGLEPLLAVLAETPAGDAGALEDCAARVRRALLAAPVPEHLATAITQTYVQLAGPGRTAVAVRSSATAEDLPLASFAGQQETYLNVVGADALVLAAHRCWASLWTDRAVAYRASNGIDHRAVRLAVVVQQMVDAQVAGVMFTANPLTGRRRQAVIEASLGLGETVVSGAVTPDYFVVYAIVERRIGDKGVRVEPLPGGGTRRVEVHEPGTQASLTDAQVRELARLGAIVEAHYGAPQDVEWARDSAGGVWLLQARPITTLFPLPEGVPQTGDDLRLYFSVNVAQGVYRPLTPMGVQAFRLFASGFSSAFGRPVRDPVAGPPFLVEAAGRLFLDITAVLRSRLGRRVGCSH